MKQREISKFGQMRPSEGWREAQNCSLNTAQWVSGSIFNKPPTKGSVSLAKGPGKGTLARQMTLAAAAAKSLQSCPTLCNPIDGSLLGSPVPGILQASTPEWVVPKGSDAVMGRGQGWLPLS